jgi:hypothetical protein
VIVLASVLWAQETRVMRRVGCDMMSGGGEEPRATLTANTWLRASWESVSDGGSGVSAARRAAASCSWARCWWWSSFRRRRGAGMAAAASSSPATRSCCVVLESARASSAISWTLQKELGCSRQQVLQQRRWHWALLGREQEEHLVLGVLAGRGRAAGRIWFWAGGGVLTWAAGEAAEAPKSQNLKRGPWDSL